jgi:hypothetical protein
VRQIAAIAMAGCAAVFAAGCGSSSGHADASGAGAAAAGNATTPTATAQTGAASGFACQSQQQQGIDASFGLRRSPGAAQALIARAERVGFQSLTVQRRSCKRYAAVLTGLRSMAQAREFRQEAAGAGFQVLIECRSDPVRGGLAVVFGHRRSRRAAVILMRAASATGFQNLQVQQDRCGDWEVDLYGVETARQRAALRREAAAAGYHVTFEPG